MTGFSRMLIWLLLSLCLGGCAAAVVGGAAAGGYYAARGDRSSDTINADNAITSEINTRLVRDKLVSAVDISVKTYRGTVTLQGTLPSQQAVQRAFELAQSVNGVTRVVNRLTVKTR